MLSYAHLSEHKSRGTQKKRFENNMTKAEPMAIDTKRIRRIVEDKEEATVGCINSHFLDSGSFTLRTKATEYAAANGVEDYAFYETEEFWKYMNDYAAFIKEHAVAIDHYANVDVIPNAELTWRNQEYLEDRHGLDPVPVVHFGSDLKWLHHYINEGYKYIALGGLVAAGGFGHRGSAKEWLDACFNIICDTKDRLPKVRVHGFGLAVGPLTIRYPWYSIDSSAWTKQGGFGQIVVPHKRKGNWVYSKPSPYAVNISNEGRKLPDHFLKMSKQERNIIKEWLKEIDMPLGKTGSDGEVLKKGVTNWHKYRRAACLLFYEKLRESIPEWPWPFKAKTKSKGFGL